MPIYQRGSSYQAVYNDSSLPEGRVRATFKTEIEARQWLAKAQVARLEGKSPATLLAIATGVPVTMSDLLERTERDHWRGMRSAKSLVLNAHSVVALIGPNTPVTELNDQVIRGLVSDLKTQGNSGSTINRKLAALSRMLRHYNDVGGTLKAFKMPRQREGQHRVRYVTEAEEAVMLKWAEDRGLSEFKDFMTVGMDTGLRTRRELLALSAANVVSRGNRPHAIIIHPHQSKNGKPRTVPMTPRVVEVAERRPEFFRDFTYANLRTVWGRMKHDMGLDGDAQFIPYCLRHTFVSRLVQRGVHLVTVKELAGHSEIMVTMRYAHLSTASYEDAILKLS